MRNFLKIVFTAIALVFVFGAFAVPETNAQVNQILKRMESRYKKLKTLRADVFYEIYNSQLEESDKMSGSLIYLPLKGKNANLRLDWKTPRSELISVVDNQYILFNSNTKQAFIGSTEKLKKSVVGKEGLMNFLNMSKAELKAAYSVKYIGAEKLGNGAKTWHLELTPNTNQSYKKADLWIDGKGMPLQMKITQKNLDTSTIFLSGLKKNKRVKVAEFKVILPTNARIIKG